MKCASSYLRTVDTRGCHLSLFPNTVLIVPAVLIVARAIKHSTRGEKGETGGDIWGTIVPGEHVAIWAANGLAPSLAYCTAAFI
jgi:hypothetical protein